MNRFVLGAAIVAAGFAVPADAAVKSGLKWETMPVSFMSWT